MKLIFVNRHQNGDTAHNRGLIDYVCKYLPSYIDVYFCIAQWKSNIYINQRVKVFKYLWNGVDEPLFKDIQLDYPIDPTTDLLVNIWIYLYPGFPGTLYFNAKNVLDQSKYIIPIINRKFNLDIPLPKDESDLLYRSPKKATDKKAMEDFVNLLSDYKKRVLISNGPVGSNQCTDFSLFENSKSLCENNKDVAFIFTQKEGDYKFDNQYFIDDHLARPNINEIDCFSRYCEILVGRRSGPSEFFHNYENLHDENKALISFTNTKEIFYDKGKIKLDWTNDFSASSIESIIKKYI